MARPLHWETNASGYAAVWAQENSRESLFAAMKRKEVYATTGPRIVVRVFAGWSFEDSDAYAPNLTSLGYSGGVPMGGTLTGVGGDAPRLLIQASKDPTGANLDRVQLVKGWLSESGELNESVYDVAVSDNRTKPRCW